METKKANTKAEELLEMGKEILNKEISLDENFKQRGSDEWRALNILQMLRIYKTEDAIKGLSLYSGRNLGEYLYTSNEEAKGIEKEVFIETLKMVDEIVEFVVREYDIRKPLRPRKYVLEVDVFRKNIKKYFDVISLIEIKKGVEDIDKKYRILETMDSVKG